MTRLVLFALFLTASGAAMAQSRPAAAETARAVQQKYDRV